MNLHEYQAKQLLKGFDVRVLGGSPVLQSSDIETSVESISTPVMVVKS